MGFKVHAGWTQLATLVAVETRLTHGQTVENSVSGSLRGYRGLSRFMDCTLQFVACGLFSSRRGKSVQCVWMQIQKDIAEVKSIK